MKKIINPWRNHEGYNCFGKRNKQYKQYEEF